MSYDDEIVKLRTNIKTSSEIKMKRGTITVNDYMREVTAENLAKRRDYASNCFINIFSIYYRLQQRK